MTIEERNKKLKAFITCLKCEVSGRECSYNCATQYEAGNMGEIIKNLEAISRALKGERKTKENQISDAIYRYSRAKEIINENCYVFNISL